MGRKLLYCVCVVFVLLLSACGSRQTNQVLPSQPLGSNSVISVPEHATPTPVLQLPSQIVTPTPGPSNTQNGPTSSPPNTPTTGSGLAPYGPPPPMTAEETQLTQQLFALINQNRASIGLYPFVWNDTLEAGARLHSWNMIHCGFSHTCPNGEDQCVRIANEGFAGYTDCGENIGLAGPYPTAWGGVYNVQESMWNEPPTGWHRIHLTSTTLHRIGVGIVVDSRGWIWFTEDMVS